MLMRKNRSPRLASRLNCCTSPYLANPSLPLARFIAVERETKFVNGRENKVWFGAGFGGMTLCDGFEVG